jgi:hypothetical protein
MTTMFNFFRAKTSRSSRARAAKTCRPALEPLEQRDVPTTLVLPETSVPNFTATFNMTEPDGTVVQVSSQPGAGGNFLGTLTGGIPLTASYCVNLNLNLFTNTTYSHAVVTTDGTTYGNPLPQAGAISWLIVNLAPSAVTPVEQDALQAAIWRTEYADGFQLDGVDNMNGAPEFNAEIAPIYLADLAALGSNTAPVGKVDWISPGTNPDMTTGQGLAALTGPIPAPHVTHVAALEHAKKGTTALTIAFSEPLESHQAKNPHLYRILAGVTVHHKTVYRGALKISHIIYNGATNTVTLDLAEPHKGAVELIIARGVLAANGAVSASAYSRVIG